MSAPVRWSQLIGQRVLARDNGQLVGSLRRLLLDPDGPAIVAAQLDGGGGGTSIVDWSAVASIGPDAVMVERAASAREPRDDREQQLLAGRQELEGKLVLTEMGDSLGQLEDLEFERDGGRLVRLHVPGEVVDVERILAFGPDMLIIPEQAAPNGEPSQA